MNVVNRKSFIALLLLFGVGFLVLQKFSKNKFQEQYESAVANAIAKSRPVDLRNIGDREWDQIVFWPPYGSLCDLGINGYPKDKKDCETSFDDGECYLLFLKDNELVERIDIKRRLIDWASSDLPKRINRDRAIFKIVSPGDFARISM